MRLIIAEKPSLARAIAEALPLPHTKVGHAIRCGKDDVVVWCAGHILEMAAPEVYAPEFKTWKLEHLPIVPEVWKHQVSSADLLQTIESWLKTADRVLHAGDPDREGQLLIDEVLHFLGYRGPVDRVLVNDLSPTAVRKALDKVESNDKYRPLYESALARQRADWLFGMNMTRLYTVLGRKGGYDGVLSVGRVQTPLLGLIVERDRAIERFRPTPYFTVVASFQDDQARSFRGQWLPNDAADSFLDEDGRLLRRDVADAVRSRTEGARGVVASRVDELKADASPLPYALADLQIDASKKLGLSAAQTLEACQRLYEQRLITYPRSDCPYLPQGHFSGAGAILRAVALNDESLARLVQAADVTLRTRAWNDAKITAHHAIIPTTTSAAACNLNGTEKAVYGLIGRRYLAQFYGAHEYAITKLELVVAGERFRATGRVVKRPGWRAVEQPGLPELQEDEPRETDANVLLPPLTEGAGATAATVTVAEKKTTPPKAFTDASLIQAMCHISRYVADPAIKRILADTDGIGTPATRAAIIETLFERGFLARQKKSIVATPTGRALIDALPSVAARPDMTAIWEAAMRAIQQKEQSLDAFLGCVRVELTRLVDQGKALGSITLHASASPPSRKDATAATTPSPRRRSRSGSRRGARP